MCPAHDPCRTRPRVFPVPAPSTWPRPSGMRARPRSNATLWRAVGASAPHSDEARTFMQSDLAAKRRRPIIMSRASPLTVISPKRLGFLRIATRVARNSKAQVADHSVPGSVEHQRYTSGSSTGVQQCCSGDDAFGCQLPGPQRRLGGCPDRAGKVSISAVVTSGGRRRCAWDRTAVSSGMSPPESESWWAVRIAQMDGNFVAALNARQPGWAA